jgi:chromosome transmission fidelity protein 8
MKRVWMYVGSHQRMLGEVKKLPRALAVLRRRGEGPEPGGGEGKGEKEELEVVEVVKYKIVFSSRPEPVGGGVNEALDG